MMNDALKSFMYYGWWVRAKRRTEKQAIPMGPYLPTLPSFIKGDGWQQGFVEAYQVISFDK